MYREWRAAGRPAGSRHFISANDVMDSCVRTTLGLPEDLVNEARSLLGFKSKTDAVVFALRDLIRRRIAHLKSVMGKVRLDVDIAASRHRLRQRR